MKTKATITEKYKYISNYVLCDIQDDKGNELTDKDKLLLLLNSFDIEYNFKNNKVRYPSLVERLSEWLEGLPSGINTEYWNCEIIKGLEKLGYISEISKESTVYKYVNEWFKIIANLLLSYARKLKIDYSFLY